MPSASLALCPRQIPEVSDFCFNVIIGLEQALEAGRTKPAVGELFQDLVLVRGARARETPAGCWEGSFLQHPVLGVLRPLEQRVWHPVGLRHHCHGSAHQAGPLDGHTHGGGAFSQAGPALAAHPPGTATLRCKQWRG
jgi:hypothetical protein